MNVITRGIRNAFRNVIRTVSIVIILGLSIGLALTMVTARQAVSSRIDTVKSSIANTITVSPAGARGFEGGGTDLTTAEIAKVKAVAHVTSVTSVLQDRLSSTDSSLTSAVAAGSIGNRFGGSSSSTTGTTSTQQSGRAPTGGGGGFSPGVTVVGADAISASVLNGGGSTFTITSGKTIDGTKDAAVALVGKALATKNNLSVGSTFSAYGTTITVAGIYDAGNTFSNNGVIMPLATVQRLSAQTGSISSAIVNVDTITNVDSTTSAISSTLGSSVADVTSAQSRSADALAPLANIQTISTYSVIGAVVAGAVIILLTMLMIVRERRREIGVLKAIGSNNLKVVGQFMAEAMTFTLIAAVVGLGIGVAAASPVTNALVTTSTSTATTGGMGGRGGGGFEGARQAGGFAARGIASIHAAVGWDILLYGLGAAVVIALLGSALPALLIAKVRPAEVMRAE